MLTHHTHTLREQECLPVATPSMLFFQIEETKPQSGQRWPASSQHPPRASSALLEAPWCSGPPSLWQLPWHRLSFSWGEARLRVLGEQVGLEVILREEDATREITS